MDGAGNSATTQITVVRQAVQPGQITMLSGNNQTGTIGTTLGAPLVISLTDTAGGPAANKDVIFAVTQNNGMVSLNGGAPAATVLAKTNAQGQASVLWTLGQRAGAGSDGVQAYSVGLNGTATFTATVGQGVAGLIVVDSGNNQMGAVNQPLPKPLIAVVIDKGHNRLAGVPVTFTIQQGGGSFSGQTSITATTDPDGRASASPRLGFQEGNSNNLISASFAGNAGFPASFTASGRAPADPTNTLISGIILDNSNQPIPGVTVRGVLTNTANSSVGSVQSAATVQTDVNGAFTISKAPVGFVKLLVDGSTATAAGSFPSLDYDMVTVAGQLNAVGQPIYLLPIKTNNQLCVTATTGGGTLSIPEAPGFSLTFVPGQVTFPGGSKTGCVSVTSVHPDRAPMVPGFGQQPRFIVTIQPSGALFNPPAPITLPNVDGLVSREVTEMYSFDHDIGSFVAIGTGTVSDDGQVIRSNPGVGVLKAGWHCGGNPGANGTVADCAACQYCINDRCIPDPSQSGASCNNACITGGIGSCSGGSCNGGNPVNCGSATVCTTAPACDPVLGCQPGMPISCGNGDICTGIPYCDSISGCQAGTPLDCGPGNICSGFPRCNPSTGCQVGTPAADGTSCGTAGQQCLSGVCAQTSCVAQADGTPCGNGGTIPGACASGKCIGNGSQCPNNCAHCVDGMCSDSCTGSARIVSLREASQQAQCSLPFINVLSISSNHPFVGDGCVYFTTKLQRP